MPLRFRILAWLTSAILGTLALAGCLVYREFARHSRELAVDQIESEGRGLKQLLHNRMDMALGGARMTVQSPAIRPALTSNTVDRVTLDDILVGSAEALGVPALILQDYTDSIRGGIGLTTAELEILAAGASELATSTEIGGAGLVDVNDRLLVAASCPVRAGRNEVGRITLASPLDDTWLRDLSSIMRLPLAVLVNGHVRASALAEGLVEGTRAAAELARRRQIESLAGGLVGSRGERGASRLAVEVTMDGVAYLAHAVSLREMAPRLDLQAVILYPNAKGHAANRRMLGYLLTLGLVGLAFSFALSAWAARSLIRPLRELATEARTSLPTVAGQNLPDDELDALSEAVRSTLASLKVKHRDEARVQEERLADAEARASIQIALQNATARHIQSIQEFASGSLGVQFADGGPSEMALLGRELNHMVARTAKVLTAITESANRLGGATSDVLENLRVQNEGFAVQQGLVDQTRKGVDGIRVTSTGVVREAERVHQVANSSAEAFALGERDLDATARSMAEISTETQRTARDIQALVDQLDKIEAIAGSVGEISEQSKLLSLNAAIEAVRAAQHGKGFAVVAQEIRHLAIQSNESMQMIKRILRDVRSASEATMATLRSAGDRVASGVEVVNRLGESYAHMRSALTESLTLATSVRSSSLVQHRALEEINGQLGQFFSRLQQAHACVNDIQESVQVLQVVTRELQTAAAGFRSASNGTFRS